MTSNANGYNSPQHLIETDWLEQHLNDPDLRIFDCTVIASLNPDHERSKKFPFAFESGWERYAGGHIPGAGYIDIPGEISDKSTELPFIVPSKRQFADAMAKHGISDGSKVVLYSTAEPMWAARVWWMLRAFGFDNVAVLNGGWAKWTAEGRPVSREACAYSPGQLTARRRPELFVGKDSVLAAIGDDKVRTINALPAPIYAGTGGPVFGRKGRIAGSVSIPFGSIHDPDTGTYLPADQLRERFDAVDVAGADRIIAYCGSGIAASDDALALALLGYENVTIYDASMSEWGNDPSLPMESD